MMKKESVPNSRRVLIPLILSLIAVTFVYQLKPFLDNIQFSYLTSPIYAIVLAILVVYSSIITIKLFSKKHFQTNPSLCLLWVLYVGLLQNKFGKLNDYVWEGEPFPSEADIFYIASYPLFTTFLFLSLKPILTSVSRNVWLSAIGLSVSFLVPSVAAAYDDIYGESSFAVS